MKRLVLMIIPALICGTMFWIASSCNKENNTNSNTNSELNIKVVGILGEPTTKSSTVEEAKVDTLLWCKGIDIEWYNATTRELKIKNAEELFAFGITGGVFCYIMYLGEEELFTLDAIASISSFSLNYPVLIDWFEGYYIGRGYPDWEYWTEKFWKDTNWDRTADWVKEREKNWKAIEQGWNKFIEQLKKEGKYRK